jgi:hypothetical protein
VFISDGCAQTPSSYVWKILQLPKHERQLGFCGYIVRRLKGAVMFPSLKKKIHKMRTNVDDVEGLLINLDLPLLVWRAPVTGSVPPDLSLGSRVD